LFAIYVFVMLFICC